MPDVALEVTRLVVRYGELTAVDGVDLTLAGGRVLALLGPNGAGKTSVVEVCEGYRKAAGGTVRVLGLDPSDRALRPKVGVMLQGGGGYPGAKAGEMLRLLASYAADPLPVDDLMQRLGLTESAGMTWKRLSGGQQQRLSLAMAVVARPEIVFLDEPTAGMDAQARLAAWDLVRSLRRDGVSVLLTTHDMAEAAELADDVVVVDHGKVVAAGTPSALTSGGPDVLRFSADPGLDVDRLSAATGHPTTEVSPGRYEVAGPTDPALVAAVATWCAAQDVLARDLGGGDRTLGEVFLDLTGRELRP